jgi:hypothetical protein
MFLERIKGVFRLDAGTFKEIEHDESATAQAAIVVFLVALLGAIGAFIGAQAANAALSGLGEQFSEFGEMDLPNLTAALSPVGALFNAFIGAFVAWLVWSVMTYFIGVNIFKGEATIPEMLRVIGFAQAPRLLSVLNFIPCIGWLFGLAGWVWAIAASFVAIREGLDLDSGKALATILLSFIAAILVNAVIGWVFGFIF